jgi:hypothetical protein
MKKYKMKRRIVNEMKSTIKAGQNPLVAARNYAIMSRIIKDRS